MTEPKTKAGQAALSDYARQQIEPGIYNDWDAIAQAAIEAARPDVSGAAQMRYERGARDATSGHAPAEATDGYMAGYLASEVVYELEDLRTQQATFKTRASLVRGALDAAFAAGEAKGRSLGFEALQARVRELEAEQGRLRRGLRQISYGQRPKPRDYATYVLEGGKVSE